MSAPLPSRSRRLFKPLLVVAVLAAAAIAWRVLAPAPAADAAPAAAATPVRVATVVREDLVVRLKALGTVTPLHTVSLRSRVDGELLRLSFREGEHVKAGDADRRDRSARLPGGAGACAGHPAAEPGRAGQRAGPAQAL